MVQNSESNILQPDNIIGYYRIIEKIGSGGMGEVYLALDTKLNRNVAIKVLLNEFFDDSDKIARFKREALTAASINHANIMSIYDIDEAVLESGQKVNYIVMEHIEGEQLDKYLLSQNRNTVSELLRIAEKLSSGIAAAHKKNVIHRDLKMGNIIINKDKVPKILDFGLAKPVDTSQINKNKQVSEDTESVVSELTQEGKIVGTISYMSPEQARGNPVDLRSDIFSLGVLFFKMFTGQFPFEGSDNISVIAKILESPHQSIRQLNTSLPSELERIINKCLQKDPSHRYQDTLDLMLDLRNLRKQYDSGVTDSISSIIEKPLTTEKKLFQKPVFYITTSIAFIAVFLFVYFFNPIQMFNSSVMARSNSLAILNFENLSDYKDTQRLGQILQELLITDLSSNNEMKVVSSQRLFDIQKKLGYEDRNKIDRSMAAEVAKQSGATTMLSGNLINTGEGWLVTGQLIDVDNGTIIKSHRLKGTDLYTMVDSLSEYILTDLSVSSELANNDNVTGTKSTISMDAYRHYFTGIDYLGEADYKNAIEEFKKAVEIEKDFSRAYYKLTIALWWQNDASTSEDNKELIELIKARTYSSKHDELLVEAALALYENRYYDALIAYQDLSVLYPDDKEVWYGLGEVLFHSGNDTRRKSLDAFERAVELDASFVLAYRHIFDLYISFRMFEKGNQTAKNLVKEKPESQMGYRYLATSSIVLYDTLQFKEAEKEALKYHITEDEILALYNNFIIAFSYVNDSNNLFLYYNKALEHNKTNSTREILSVYDNVMRYYESHNQDKNANLIFEKALNCNVDQSHIFNVIVNRAQRYFDNIHTRKKAHQIIDKGLALDTAHTFANLYNVKAQLYLAERKYDSAVYYAERALSINKGVKNSWTEKVYFDALLYNKEYKLAEEYAKQLLTANVMSPDYRSLIRVYVNSGLFDKADSLVDYVIQIDTSSSRQISFLTNVAHAYKNINEQNKALLYFNRILKLDPENTNALSNQATCNFLLGNYSESEHLANLLLEKDETKRDALFILSRIYLYQNKFKKAKEVISQVDLTNGSSFRLHGYYYKELGNYDSALYYVDSAYALDQQFFSINLLAWLLVKGNFDIDRGLTLANDALQSPNPYNQYDSYVFESPYVPLPQHTLGLAYFVKGDYSKSKKYFEQAIGLRPNDEEIQRDYKICLDKITN